VILLITVRIGRDVRVEKPDFAILNRDVRVLELDPALHNALDFGSDEHGSGLVLVVDMVFVKSLAVRQDFFVDRHKYSECAICRVVRS